MAARFHASGLPAGPGGQVELSTSESHHAMHVLRLKVGDEVELFDGTGGVAAARIVQARHGKVSVELTGAASPQAPYAPAIHLAFAIPRGKRVDWLLEKATELGATSLRPILTERSVAGGQELSDAQRERWLGHCIAAAKQCGLNFLPQIHGLVPLEELLKELHAVTAAGSPSPCRCATDLSLQGRGEGSTPLAIVGDLSPAARPLREVLAGRKSEQEIILLVGPEGDFTPAELEACGRAGVVRARMGPTTMRVETAAIALLASAVTATR